MNTIPSADLQRILKANLGNWIAWNLITIAHPDKATPLRYVNSKNDLTHDGNVYKARAFTVARPAQGKGISASGDITIDNSDLEISDFTRRYSLLKRATLTLTCVSNTDLDRVLVGPYEFVIKQTAFSERGDLVFALGFEDTLQESYPFPTFDEHYPALYGVEAS